MKRRLFSVMMALVLCLGMLPGTARAEEWPYYYREIKIGGVQVNERNHMDPLGDGTVFVSYEMVDGLEKWIITLDNAKLTDQIYVKYGSLVDIILKGDNSITTSGSSLYGINSFGNITIKGDGSLTITVGGDGNYSMSSAIIANEYSKGDVPGNFSGDIKIEGVPNLVLNGYTNAIRCDGCLEIADSGVTASSPGAREGGAVLFGRNGIAITESQVLVENTGDADGILSLDYEAGIVITDSSIQVDSTGTAISLWGDLEIVNSEITAHSSRYYGIAVYDYDTISIRDNSVVDMTGYSIGAFTFGDLEISDSEVTALAQTGYAMYADRVSADNSVATFKGFGVGLIANGGLSVNGGSVDAISTNYLGFQSTQSLTIDSGTFHAKGGESYPAVCITVTDEEASKGNYTLDTSRIRIAPGLGETSGGKAAVSDWYESSEGTWTFMTSFIASDAPALETGGTNALNEVTIDVVKADYSSVNAAIAQIPSDLSAYTNESVAALNNAKNAVNWNLSVAQQTTVDNYAKAIETAIAGLVFISQNPETCTVRFMNGDAEYTVVTIQAGSKITSPASPTQDGYDFQGWYTDPAGTTAFDFGTPVDAEITLYAKWTVHTDPVKPVEPTEPSEPVEPSDPVRPVDPVCPPSSSSSTGSPSSGGSSSKPPLPVSTTGQNSVSIPTQTTAQPDAATHNGMASTTVSAVIADEIVRQAVENQSETVVIAPAISGSVTKTEVSIPASTVRELSEQTSADLSISTPVAEVSIPNGSLSSLESSSGMVTVAAEKSGNMVELSITADGKAVDSVPVTLTVPLAQSTPGTVAVLVHEDGTREIVRKSVATDDSLTIPLTGPAALEILDNGRTFSDLPSNAWAADAAAFVSARQIFTGTGPDTFSPDIPMTRAMLTVALHNLEGNPPSGTAAAFVDVPAGVWYAEAVAWANASGIVTGYTEDLFGPNDAITREQLAVMFWRAAGRPAPSSASLPFADADQAEDYARDALCWAVELGVLHGKGGGILDPKGLATRAQAAQMVKNYLENIV